MTFVHGFVAHWGYISAAIIVFIKWCYNAGAFAPNVTFKQFMRGLIGEIVQEAPPPPLTLIQQKILLDAEVPHATV